MKLEVLTTDESKEDLIKVAKEQNIDDIPINIHLLSTSISNLSSIGDVATNDEDPNSIGIVLRGDPGDKQTEAGIRLALAAMMEYLLDNAMYNGSFMVSMNSFISIREYNVFIFSFKELLLTTYRSLSNTTATLIVTDWRE